MTIYDFIGLFSDTYQRVNIYDLADNVSKVVWTGEFSELVGTKYADMEICSIDCIYYPTDTLTINVDTSEE